MAKPKEYAITMEQGQFLLGLATQFRMPDKLGAQKIFTAIERAAAERDVLSLYDAIKHVSPMLRKTGKERGNMFGPEENWEIKHDADGNPMAGDVKNVAQEVKLLLSEKAVSGAMWCILLCCHPETPLAHAGAQQMSDLLFPLAFRLRRLMALEDELGLRNAKSKDWEEDEEPETPALAAPAEQKETTVLKREPAAMEKVEA